jgi:hypothetical protein
LATIEISGPHGAGQFVVDEVPVVELPATHLVERSVDGSSNIPGGETGEVD